MPKIQTTLWVIVFFIAIVFFILICQSGKKSAGGGHGENAARTRRKLPGSSFTVGRPPPPPPPSEDGPKTIIYVQPIDSSIIAVEVSADATTEDLVQQTQSQLDRRINLLTFQGRPLEHGATLADQGIGREVLVTETMGTSTIRFNTNEHSILINNVWGEGRNAVVDLYIAEEMPNYNKVKASLRIPMDCLEDLVVLQRGWKSNRNEPREIKLRRDCDLNRIFIVSLGYRSAVTFNPNTVCNLVFGAPRRLQYPNVQWFALGFRN